MDSAHSAGAHTTTLLVMVDRVKGGGRAPHHPRQAGLILPSNVRHKVAIAPMCTLWT